MTAVTDGLRELHTLHLALRGVRKDLARGPQQIAAREQLISKAEEKLAEQTEQLKQTRAAADRKSLDLKSNEAKINDLRAKLNAASSNKEYDIIRGQIDADTMANSVLEDEVLELLDKADSLSSTIRETEASIEKSRAELDEFAERTRASTIELKRREEELLGQLQDAEKVLSGEVAQTYKRLVRTHGADALAASENGVCSGCYVALTPQNRVAVNSGKFVFCGSCGRLLYQGE